MDLALLIGIPASTLIAGYMGVIIGFNAKIVKSYESLYDRLDDMSKQIDKQLDAMQILDDRIKESFAKHDFMKDERLLIHALFYVIMTHNGYETCVFSDDYGVVRLSTFLYDDGLGTYKLAPGIEYNIHSEKFYFNDTPLTFHDYVVEFKEGSNKLVYERVKKDGKTGNDNSD